MVETTPDGAPASVLRRGRVTGVARIHDSWRIDDEWWRAEISRRYYAVELDNGSRLVVYQELLTGSWYVQPYRGPQLDRIWRGKPA